MRCMYRALLLSLLLVTAFNLPGQNVLPIGTWRSHLPYQSGERVTQSDSEIFYATPWSVLILDKEENSTRFLTTVQGLSNTGIRTIKYHPGRQTLIIVYNNSVIDLWQDGGVTTLNQIKNFLNIPGEKRVNDVFVPNDSLVYLAASYGVSALNIRSAEFTFTTFTGVAVNAVTEVGGFLYAATNEGIYRIDSGDELREDFGRWEYLDSAAGFPDDYSSHSFAIFDGRLFLDIDHRIHWLDEQGVPQALFERPDNLDLIYLSAEGDHLLAGFRCVSGDCGGAQGYYFRPDGSNGRLTRGCFGFPYYALEDERGRVWYGDGFRFFRRAGSVDDESCNQSTIDSPYSERSWDIDVHNGKVWVAAGALDQTLSNRFVDHGFASFADGRWSIYNRWTRDEMRGENRDPSTPQGRSDDLFDILSMAVDPLDGTAYAGSFLEGIMAVSPEDELTLYNEKNSSLQTTGPNSGVVRVGGMAFDEQGNLWISNHSAQDGRPIAVRRNDGTWQSFGQSCGQTELFDMEVDIFGNKWARIGSSQAGLLIFNEGNPDDPSDDRCRVVTAGNSNLPTNTVNCLAADLNGDVWVGTDDGVVIFECGNSVFDADLCIGTRRVVSRDGFGANLLETENVLTIAVDGANRKWVGTGNGLFLISADGEEEIANYNTSNSPLFDNQVQAIGIDQQTGEVFIGTGKGIISYQSDAVAGNRLHSSNIVVYPNPVRPEYTGPIAIRGLARDAVVKITDLSGKLVFETDALGGQAIWDGRDYNGRRAQSGVYLVFSSSNPANVGFGNPDSAVARILFIN